MSHQGHEGWFPECAACGSGNLAVLVCLDPTCHERNAGTTIEDAPGRLEERDGHWWRFCRWCDRALLADPGAWGSFALCGDCWNVHARGGTRPPTRPRSRGTG